ncbi:MAG: Smr/MutS family protein [Eubacteriales bacterium]|nr:Smr/MutS family protein [Eubacteriales bacterium]
MGQQIRQINLEDDKPTVQQALARMQLELRLAKRQGICVLKIIHGFGSTGNGGKIRVAVRRELPEYQKRGQIQFFVPGEKLTIFEEDTRRLLRICPAFRKDHDIDRYNNGITVVVLKDTKG